MEGVELGVPLTRPIGFVCVGVVEYAFKLKVVLYKIGVDALEDGKMRHPYELFVHLRPLELI